MLDSIADSEPSQPHVLVPTLADGDQVAGGQSAKPTKKDTLLGSNKPIQPRNRWLEQAGSLPIEQADVERTVTKLGSYAANHGIRPRSNKTNAGRTLPAAPEVRWNWQSWISAAVI